MDIYIALYCFALLIQLAAALVAISAFQILNRYRFGWLLLAAGLFLMVGRRITPLLNATILPADAILSPIISLLLLLGIFTVKKITQDLHKKEIQLKRMLQYDHLTQVFSRPEIFHRGHIEVERAQRNQQPLGILMIDVDHFKEVNDHFGHQAGDEILSSLADHCLRSLREIDMMGRVGGEEFLILLPNTTLETSSEVAERIRCYIQRSKHRFAENQTAEVTISIGITCFNPKEWQPGRDHSHIFKQLFKVADQAMYQAKKAGRNHTAAIGADSF